jgi:hypothetical protein
MKTVAGKQMKGVCQGRQIYGQGVAGNHLYYYHNSSSAE